MLYNVHVEGSNFDRNSDSSGLETREPIIDFILGFSKDFDRLSSGTIVSVTVA